MITLVTMAVTIGAQGFDAALEPERHIIDIT
jgi:hypothetical protein